VTGLDSRMDWTDRTDSDKWNSSNMYFLEGVRSSLDNPERIDFDHSNKPIQKHHQSFSKNIHLYNKDLVEPKIDCRVDQA
jgi:hypothetical protein